MLVFSLGASATEITPRTIILEEGNHFPITSQFNGKLLDDFTEKVLTHEDKELILYFNTPGGSVVALSRMARIMKGSDIKFICVANFAASAGFMLFQHCSERLLLSDGVLMSHNWAGTFSDEAPRILTMYNTIQSLVSTIEATAISKMNVDAKEYAALINNNLWMTSVLANKYAAIDNVIDRVTCSKSLIKQRNPISTRGRYGSRGSTIYKSGCPLIQKTYKKASNSDVYIPTNITEFEIAQKEYVPMNANWIYMGDRPE